MVQLITPKGGKTQVILPDGTKIWLNADSKLTYPEIFSGAQREVSLEGEGYFVVAKDKAHPFIVKTSDVDVRAVGTEFNLKCYPNEGTIETTLIEGSVVVSENYKNEEKTQLATLKTNQRATFIRSEGIITLTETEKKKISANDAETLTSIATIKQHIIVSEAVNTDPFTVWRSNKLLFDNETFESISFKLERRYGCKILFLDNEVEKYCFSGRFDEISVEQALKALQYASSFNYKIDNDTIRISSESIVK